MPSLNTIPQVEARPEDLRRQGSGSRRGGVCNLFPGACGAQSSCLCYRPRPAELLVRRREKQNKMMPAMNDQRVKRGRGFTSVVRLRLWGRCVETNNLSKVLAEAQPVILCGSLTCSQTGRRVLRLHRKRGAAAHVHPSAVLSLAAGAKGKRRCPTGH